MKKRSLGVLVFFWAIRASIEAQSSSPTVQFSSANYSAVEGAGVANLTITKMGATNMPVTAYYKTRDGTATAPSDYTFTGDDLTASVTFQPGETRKSIQIALKNDGFREPDETFQVFFTVVSNATVGMPDTATVTIIDDDPQGPEPPALRLEHRQQEIVHVVIFSVRARVVHRLSSKEVRHDDIDPRSRHAGARVHAAHDA